MKKAELIKVLGDLLLRDEMKDHTNLGLECKAALILLIRSIDTKP